MKKFMSLFLALVMVCSLSVSAFAASNETVITYTGEGSEAYTITVPTTLQPGQSGEVKAEGTWATNRTLKVTTADTVTVANSIDGGEKVLDVTFAGIDQAGDNTTSISVSKTISVGSISNALFGTWTGVITYNVSMEDNGATPAPTLISFTIDGTSYQAEEGMTWAEWVDSDYNKDGYKLGTLGTDFTTIGCNSFSHHSTDNVIATASSHYGDSNIVGKRIETTGLTEVDQAEVIVAMNYELGVCGD